MTMDLRSHVVEPTSMVAMARVNNLGNAFYSLLLDNGSVYEHQTLHNFIPGL